MNAIVYARLVRAENILLAVIKPNLGSPHSANVTNVYVQLQNEFSILGIKS